MARNLLQAGHQLVVFDLVREAVQQLTAQGAHPARSIKALASDVELVISMLPSSPHVRQVYLGSEGVLSGAPPGALLVDSSTIDPHTAREVAAAAAAQGCNMVDAPVSGGTLGAEAGTLTFMVGGSAEDFERASPVLAAMGKNIVHCGARGNGQVAKLCNNLLLGISMIGVAEAMALGASLGIDAKVLAGVINTSSGRCWSSDTYNPFPGVLPNVPSARDYAGGFSSNLMLKDLALAIESARQTGQPVPLGALANQMYQLLASMQQGDKDFSAIIKLYRKT